MSNKRYFSAEGRQTDDFGVPFTGDVGEIVYDAKTRWGGRWATMTEHSFERNAIGKLGIGYGQKYQRNAEGQLILIEGGTASEKKTCGNCREYSPQTGFCLCPANATFSAGMEGVSYLRVIAHARACWNFSPKSEKTDG